MSMYVFDTDHFSLLRHGHKEIVKRLTAIPVDELAITVVTVEEQLSGWYTQIRKARGAEKLTRAYDGLWQTVDAIKQVRVLPFSRPAVDRYLKLRKSLPRLVGQRHFDTA